MAASSNQKKPTCTNLKGVQVLADPSVGEQRNAALILCDYPAVGGHAFHAQCEVQRLCARRYVRRR